MRNFLLTLIYLICAHASCLEATELDDAMLHGCGYELETAPLLNLDLTATINHLKIPDWIVQSAKEDSVVLNTLTRSRVVINGRDYQINNSYAASNQLKELDRIRQEKDLFLQANLSDNSLVVTKTTKFKLRDSQLYGELEYFWRATLPLLTATKINSVERTGGKITVAFDEFGTSTKVTMHEAAKEGSLPGTGYAVDEVKFAMADGATKTLTYTHGQDGLNGARGALLALPSQCDEVSRDARGEVTDHQTESFFVTHINDTATDIYAKSSLATKILDGVFTVTDKRLPGMETRYLCRDALPPTFVVEELFKDSKFKTTWNEFINASSNK